MAPSQRTFCNEVCIQEVAKELGLSFKTVRTIVDSQFEYVKVVMESDSFDSIRLPYLGVFKSKPKEVQMINHLKGMDPIQASEFKKMVRTGKIKLNHWEDKLKAERGNKRQLAKEANNTDNTLRHDGSDPAA